MSASVPAEIQDRMRAFQTLSTPSATRLLLALAGGPLALAELAGRTGYSPTYAYTQMKALLLAGALIAERQGRCVRYRINRDPAAAPARAVLRVLDLIE
jgi:DNA-binding transcriptional ArsR family regulator